MKLIDLASHPALSFRFRDLRGGYRRVVVLRATYSIGPNGTLARKTPAPPINFEERCFGEMLETAPREESHLAPCKSKVDVVVHANAHAPGGRPTERFGVELAIRARSGDPLHARSLAVTGMRHWIYGGLFGSWSLGDPAPVAVVPLRFDLAYGGTVRLDDPSRGREQPVLLAHDDNPIGVGFVPSVDRIAEACDVSTSTAAALLEDWCERNPRLAAPFVEHPDRPLRSIDDRPEPAGWGLIAKHWASRYRHAGTYDASWAAERHPLLPVDFDDRYWNGAHADLQLDALPADASIELTNLVPLERAPDQRVRIALPGLQPEMSVRDVAKPGPERFALRLDTAIVDLIDDELTLLYRADVEDTPTLAWIELEDGPHERA